MDIPEDIHDESIAGHFTNLRDELRETVGNLIENCDGIYIGRTSAENVTIRAWWHENRDPDLWDEMILVYRTGSPNYVLQAEADLINFFWEYCDNDAPDGRGSFGDPPYYVYVLCR